MMQVAKATPEDVREAFNVNNILELLDSNTMPEDWIDENNGDDYFDKDSDSQCGMVMRNLLELVNPSALFRVAMGMSVLIDPVNKILNQDSDVLEYHPDIVAAASRIAQLEAELAVVKLQRDTHAWMARKHEITMAAALMDDMGSVDDWLCNGLEGSDLEYQNIEDAQAFYDEQMALLGDIPTA